MSLRPLSVLLDAAIGAAFQAGREIMEVYARPFTVDHKADRSPLTEADRRAHAAIEEALRATALPVLSEEGVQIPWTARSMWTHYWLVDPLDGTREFVKRNGEFSVNIALMEQPARAASPEGAAVPVAGVIYAPVDDLLYFGWKGGGAYRQEHAATREALPAYERAAMSARLPLNAPRTAYTVLASRSHRNERTEAFIREVEAREKEVVLASRGSALKFGTMAEGVADVYPRFGPTMEWDTAAGQVICAEAGRQVTDVATGQPLRYNKHELVNPAFIVH